METHIAFLGERCLVRGPLAEVLGALKARFDRDPHEVILVFEMETGRQVDFDLRGTLDDVLARQVPARGPGRPKLGVTAREVTLLPRHWEWLERQPAGASATLRQLVEQASRAAPDMRQVRDALSRVLTALAGDLPGYEEATRALFAGDLPRFEARIARWPADVRAFALERARAAAGVHSSS